MSEGGQSIEIQLEGRSAWWRDDADCRGYTDVFLESGIETKAEREDRERVAKSICATCSVRVVCLEFAIENREPHDVWGGCNEKERRGILKQRKSA